MEEGASMEAFPAEQSYTPSLDDDPALGLSHRAKMEVLFAVMLGLFLGALDQTIVGPALPTIVTQLNGNDLYVWVVTSYLLTSTISVPFWGKLSDLYGRKPMFIIGIVIFLIGSALSGLSQNMEQLILFRGIQGIGAGALFPIALAIIGDLFSPAERGKYQGLFGAVFGVAFVAGPLIGGWLTENVGWHWIFYVNIPIGIVSLFVISRLLPTVKNARAERNFDILGGVIFTIATTLLLIGLTAKGLINSATNALYDWTDWQVGGLILAGLVGYLAFLWAETRAKEPIVPLNLFGNRTYASSMVSTFFAAFAFFGAIVFLPRWFQIVQGFSPTNSGLAALPLVIGLIGSSIGSGLFVARTGRYKWLLVGAISLMAIAMLLMTQLRADTPVPIVWLWMFIAGLGVGPTFAVFTLVVQNAVPFQFLGVATSNLTFFRQIGGSVALAIVGTVFSTEIVKQLPVQVAASGMSPASLGQIGAAAQAGKLDFNQLIGTGDLATKVQGAFPTMPADDVAKFVSSVLSAFSLAVSQTFWIGVVGAVLAVLAAIGMKELALRQQTPAQAAAAAKADGATADGGRPAIPAAD
jgi:EmrB/QacA subfamily drug resistance transporter